MGNDFLRALRDGRGYTYEKGIDIESLLFLFEGG